MIRKQGWFKIIFFVLMSLTLFVSCEKEEDGAEGKAWYAVATFDYQLSSLEDFSVWETIQEKYQEAFAAIDGVSMESGKFMLKGNYDKSDKKIIAACQRVESEIGDMYMKGYVTMSVTATYQTKLDVNTVHEFTFGNK